MSAECAVHIACRLHDHGVVHGILHFAAGSFFRQHQLGILHIAGDDLIADRLVSCVHNFHAFDGNADSCGGLFDHCGIIDEYRYADSFVENSAGSQEGLVRLTLGERDSLGI